MIRRFGLPVSAVVLACFQAGCVGSGQDGHEAKRFGQVWYLDGAGGGNILTNWGGGVRVGLKAAGFQGKFTTFVWNTGLGVAADQSSNVAYKRRKAATLAGRIVRYADSHADRPVHIIGLSAGTAVVAFGLEALPEDHPVDDVVLLGSSLSSHYDMTEALKRVRDRLYVFTSERDAVLGIAVPITGTADRQFCGACAVGLRGFHLPANADDETKRLYHKIENIRWRPEFAEAGNFGGHTGAVNKTFVRRYVAPLLRREGPRFYDAGLQPAAETD